MEAAVEATTATAAPQASEQINVIKPDDVGVPGMEAAAPEEPKQEVESAAAGTAAALAVPEAEPAEAPAAAAAAPSQNGGAHESMGVASEAAAAPDEPVHKPAVAETKMVEPAAADVEPVVVAPAAETVAEDEAGGKEAASAAAEASPVAGKKKKKKAAAAAPAQPNPAQELAGDVSTAADVGEAAGIAAPGSTLSSTEQQEQDGAAAAAADSTASAAAAAEATAEQVVDVTAIDGRVAAADGEKEAALVDAAPATGTVAAAKALFLQSQTSGDSAAGTRTLAPLSMRGSRISSTSNGAARASSNGGLVGGSSVDDETGHIKVRELREQLSATHPNLTGGSLPPSRPDSPGREEREKGPLPLLSEHDKVNTVNVTALLATAEFKLVPGIDRVPYEELIKLRLEDGVDVTRKEEYLSDADFKMHLGVDREAFEKLPQWKKLQLKKGKMLF
uniref:HP domain-containing protein n=1 Tax=Tetradesmus obliquus TaxID=3088 RepID=A0A383VYJ2_TETOB|eukprot:jgi/Sobl393_1/4829/SZX70281.1